MYQDYASALETIKQAHYDKKLKVKKGGANKYVLNNCWITFFRDFRQTISFCFFNLKLSSSQGKSSHKFQLIRFRRFGGVSEAIYKQASHCFRGKIFIMINISIVFSILTLLIKLEDILFTFVFDVCSINRWTIL